VARLLITRLVLARSYTVDDATVTSQMVPKGLAVAVLASVPAQYGMPGAETLQSVAYAVVLFSILMTSLLVPVSQIGLVGRFYRRIFSGYASAPARQEAVKEPSPV